MSQSESAGEQSMEEILASIRGTVSNSESKPAAESASSSKTPEPSASTPPPPASPVPHRLSEALSRVSGEQTPQPRTGPPPTSAQSFGTAAKPSAIDDDLSDMFEDPQPAATNGTAPPPPAPPTDNNAGSPAAPLPGRALSFGARMAAGAVSITPQPSPASTTPPPASGTSLSSEHVQPPSSKSRTTYSGLGPMPATAPPSEGSPSTVSRQDFSGDGSSDQGPKAPEVIAAMPAAGTASASVETTSAEKDSSKPSPNPLPLATNGSLPQGSASLAALAATLGQLSADALQSNPAVTAKPDEPTPTSAPVSEIPPDAASVAPASATVDVAPAADSPAPDELAAVEGPATVQDGIAATATIQDDDPVQADAEAGMAPRRTLEDVVVDILRPQLQSWLEANMPRIVERALRAEAAGGKKSETR